MPKDRNPILEAIAVKRSAAGGPYEILLSFRDFRILYDLLQLADEEHDRDQLTEWLLECSTIDPNGVKLKI